MTVAIVTDSTADLPPNLAEELDVRVVPLTVSFGTESYLDGVTIKGEEFYQRLQSEKVFPTTAQPSVGAFVEAYRDLAQRAEGILSIHLSSTLSGTYNSAVQAEAELAGSGAPISVIDSRHVSMGLGLIVVELAKAARDGAGVPALNRLAEDLIPRTRIYFMVDTLEYLHRGGRIGRASAFLGSLLRFHPLCEIKDGAVEPLERPRSRRKGIQRLRELADDAKPVAAASVVGSADPDAARALADGIADICADRGVIVSEFGPVVGAHAGPGTIGFAYIERAESQRS